MAKELTLEDVRRAWEARDPELVEYVRVLAEQPDKRPDKPIREGAMTFDRFLAIIQSTNFHLKPEEEQRQYRVQTMQALEAPDAEVPLSDRLKLHQIILTLWQQNDPFSRACLLKIIANVRLIHGPWRALKRIYKEAEARDDTEILGALIARLDTTYASGQFSINRLTMAYMVRRCWRYLRQLARRLPVLYADACAEVLANYPEGTNWHGTWVANHIFYHETRQYSRSRFVLYPRPTSLLKHRAFEELWQRSPRPLFSLLERAKCEHIWEFATQALKSDFRAVLREVEPAWVARLVTVGSKTIDEFVVWLLKNVPRFEQARFRDLGLHEPVLKLFDSKSPEARVYAAEYARTHARDLPVPELMRLVGNDNEAVRKLALDLLRSRDPRTQVGLDAWGQLLETRHGHELAASTLRKSFGAQELTPAWFKARLFSRDTQTFNFAKNLLPQVHPYQKLGPGFFCDLIDELEAGNYQVANFALAELARFDLNSLDRDFLKRLLLHPLTRQQAINWINEGRLKTSTLPAEFFKLLAYHPAWEKDAWIAQLRQRPREWAKKLAYDENLANQVFEWLRDVRRFSSSDLGFDWLLQLAARSEPRYHDFAVDTMIRSFVPADFAPRLAVTAQPEQPAQIDLKGQTFVFTGTMATMKRQAAEEMVKQANGVVVSSVTSKLHYLVIGDKGAPAEGEEGKKSTKQLKAEELNAAGANIKILSETAFLQMMSGKRVVYSEDDALAGAEKLWEMAIAPGGEELSMARFARRYIRRHHPDICIEETDRPVNPGAEIPQSFFTFERIRPLLHENRKPLREFALKIARWEFNRWSPPVPELLRLAESPYSEVREFVQRALLADDAPEHRRYRVDPATLTPAAVYSFCESPDEQTRDLGMQLISRHPHLQVPEELFRLTESADRKVRGFVIRTMWSLYRDRGITTNWKPYVPPQTTVGAAARKAAEQAAQQRGEGAPPRPDQLPAAQQELSNLLHRVLFEVPPARLEPSKAEEPQGLKIRMKPLPARRAKLAMVEVLRDLALEEVGFARIVLPVLREFMISRGQSEMESCLVAVTRIQHRHPELKSVMVV